MVENSPAAIQRYLDLISKILERLGNLPPTRKNLERIAKTASQIARPTRPWTGSYLYILMHLDRYPGYSINALLVEALDKMTQFPLDKLPARSTVWASEKIQPGALVLVASRPCLECSGHFVPAARHQRYCTAVCAKAAKLKRERARRERV